MRGADGFVAAVTWMHHHPLQNAFSFGAMSLAISLWKADVG